MFSPEMLAGTGNRNEPVPAFRMTIAGAYAPSPSSFGVAKRFASGSAFLIASTLALAVSPDLRKSPGVLPLMVLRSTGLIGPTLICDPIVMLFVVSDISSLSAKDTASAYKPLHRFLSLLRIHSAIR